MNKWFKLALFAFIGMIVLNLVLNVFFMPASGNYGYYGNNQIPMHNGPMMRGMMN